MCHCSKNIVRRRHLLYKYGNAYQLEQRRNPCCQQYSVQFAEACKPPQAVIQAKRKENSNGKKPYKMVQISGMPADIPAEYLKILNQTAAREQKNKKDLLQQYHIGRDKLQLPPNAAVSFFAVCFYCNDGYVLFFSRCPLFPLLLFLSSTVIERSCLILYLSGVITVFFLFSFFRKRLPFPQSPLQDVRPHCFP